jgi:hypothetical protein
MFSKKPKLIVEYNTNRIDFNQVSSILAATWDKLEDLGLDTNEIKVIYSVITEMLENVYRYSLVIENNTDYVRFSILEIKPKEYLISTTNLVDTTQYEKLKLKIDFVNSLNQIGLKKYYQHEIVRTKNDNHNGAGLGLIIISRKIEQPITIEMQKTDNNAVLVTLKVLLKL